MSKFCWISIFFIVCASRLLGQMTPSNSVFWEISGNGLEQSSYLFGTVNFLPADKFSIPKEVEEALKRCKVFATKIPLDNQTRKKFNEAIKIPNNGWINDYLTDDELNHLRLLLLLDFEVKENDYYDYYSRLQPIILVTATAALHLGDNIIYPEKALEQVAQKGKLDFVGLSTVREEIEAFQKFPVEDQVEALKYTVNNFYQHLAEYDNMAKAYLLEQDLETVKNETFKATNESRAFKKVYYDARLTGWLPKIENMISKEATFLALGVPFLVGEINLIGLLRDSGYTVKPVTVSF